jgi:CheY-like chemotaxis protein
MNKSFQGIRLLVVDDHKDSCDLIVMLFEQYGARVMAVHSVSDALLALESFKPHVLISDLVMPEQDGYALLRHLRESKMKLPTIALTAAAKQEDRDRAIDAGFCEYISKPVDLQTVVRTVSKLVLARQSA